MKPVLSLILTAVSLAAQSYPGRYTAPAEGGDGVLTLRQTGSGAVEGSMVFPNGTAIQINAKITAEGLVGTGSSGTDTGKFVARLIGNQLITNVDGFPIVFTRQQAAAPQPPAQAPAQPAKWAQPSAPAREIHEAAWGVRFTPPAGYQAQRDQIGYLFKSPNKEAGLAVMPHTSATLADLRRIATEGFISGDTKLTPRGPVQQVNANTIAVDYAGTLEGEGARARMVAVLSPHGGGALVMAMAPAQQFTADHAASAETVARTFRFEKIDTTSVTGFWRQRLIGRKLQYFSRYSSSGVGGFSGYSEHKQLSLCSDGSFLFNGDFSGAINVPGASANLGNRGGNAGSWKIVPQLKQAVLQLSFADGSEASYTLAIEDGKTFLNGNRWYLDDKSDCR
jgi:hypothetical protein